MLNSEFVESSGDLSDPAITLPNIAKVDRYGRRLDGGLSDIESSPDEFDGIDSEDSEAERAELSVEEESTSETEDEASMPDLSDIATSRVALKDLDWDNLTAVDILAVLQSVAPTTQKVTVYPSSLGRERLEQERQHGPRLSGTIREYYLERLKYFYAIATFPDAQAAAKLVHSANQMEIGASSNTLNLSFVPEDMSFEDDEIREEADSIPDGYEPVHFVTSALQETNCKDTWDQGDVRRKKALQKKFTADDVDKMDLKAYLASSSESEDEVTKRNRRNLLLEAVQEGAEGDESVFGRSSQTAVDNASDSDSLDEEFTIDPELDNRVEEVVRRKITKTPKISDETTLDRIKRKEAERKQRKKERRAAKIVEKNAETQAKEDAVVAASESQLRATMDGDEDDEARHFDLREVVKKHKLRSKSKLKKWEKQRLKRLDEQTEAKTDPGEFVVDESDDRFKLAGATSEFAIDPTNPNFRKTPAMEKFMTTRAMRRTEVAD